MAIDCEPLVINRGRFPSVSAVFLGKGGVWRYGVRHRDELWDRVKKF
ncbi:MAG: hypothetical protein LBK00_04245 [Treponema sp.]|jgi:hypothetical protein|nr:hypothetical protein [Treponema sp.]